MGLTRSIASGSLFGRPARTILSILGVAVGIATVVAVFTLDHVTVFSRSRSLVSEDVADLEVRPKGDVADPAAELASREGVAGVKAFFENDVGFRSTHRPAGAAPELVRLVAAEEGSALTLGVYRVDVGEDLSAETGRDGVLVGQGLARDFDLSIGSVVALTQPARAAKSACIEGEMRAVEGGAATEREGLFRVVGILSREGLGRVAGGRVVVTSYTAGRDLLRDTFVDARFWLRRDPGVAPETLEAGLEDGFTFERNASRAVGQMADERAFRNGVRLAGLFALLLGLYVIFHTLSMSLVERVREVGVLSALGTTRAQIARIFFVEALVIAVAAGALGLGGGLLFARVLLERGITTLGVVPHSVRPFVVPWERVVLLVSLGVVVALFGSIYPILRARDTDAVRALRGEERGRRAAARGFQLVSVSLLVLVVPALFFRVVPIIGAAEPALLWTLGLGFVVLGLLVGLPLLAPGIFGAATAFLARPFKRRWPLAGELAIASLTQGATRTGAAVAAIALVTAAFTGLRGMTASLSGEIEEWGERAVARKVFVRGLPDLKADELSRTLHALPEVRGVEAGGARAFPSFLLIGLRTDEIAHYGPLAQDPALADALRAGRTIVVSERLARQRELAVGDVVLVNTGAQGIQEFRVGAISDAYGYFPHPDERAYGVIDEREAKRLFCVEIERASSISVELEGGDAGLVETALRDAWPELGPLEVTPGPAIVAALREDLEIDFVLFDIILFSTAILAGLGILNGQLLSALERQKELGILKALGTTRGQVAAIVVLESVVVGVAGGALGCLVGAGLSPVLVSALRVLSGLALPFRVAAGALAFGAAGAVLLALLAALYPIFRMNRVDAVRAVRTG
jgi:putative ABC transport system permease protein